MKCCGVGDSLDVVGIGGIGIVDGNGLATGNGDRSGEGGAQVRVLFAAVASIKTRVHVKAFEIGEPFLARLASGGSAAIQNLESAQINRLLAMRHQVGIDESGMAQLIVGVVGDVLRHVTVQVLQGLDVGGIPTDETLKLFIGSGSRGSA